MRRRLPDVSIRARALPLSLIAIGMSIAICGCRPDEVSVDLARTRSHVDALAGAIGNRPVGSAAASRARDYLVTQLEQTGLTVRLQRADAVDGGRALTVPVVNIVASRNGAEPAAVALVAHYDSAADAAGALDDALGIAVCLETARLLAAPPLRHSLFVILTDGEEAGMMGARAVIEDPEVARRVQAFLNFDGTGAAGPPLLFEAAPGDDGRSMLGAWASGAPEAAGGSFSTEIYRRLPNDTDFTIFRSLGVPGLNFAAVGDSYAYHTDRDVASRVRIETMRQAIANAVGSVRRMDRDGLAPVRADPTRPGRPGTQAAFTIAVPAETDPAEPTYFDVVGIGGITYPKPVARAIAWTAAVLAAIVWVRQFALLLGRHGGTGVLLSLLRGLASAVVIAVAMAGVGLALAAGREPLHFWYAAPHWLFASTIAAGLLGWTSVSALGWQVPDRFEPPHAPHAVWWLALPIWIALTIVLDTAAPAASYLTALPLLVASVALLFAGARDSRLRAASAIALVAAAHFWITDTARLLAFMVPLFGWMGIVPPVWIFAVLIAVALLMCGPPAAAIVAGRRPRAAAIAPLASAAVVAIAFAAAAPAYTAHRPERRMLRFVQDDILQRAWWEQGGAEPHAAVEQGAPVAGEWQPVRGAPETSVTIPPVFGAFRFRADAPARAAPPADVRLRTTRVGEALVEVAIGVVPREYLWATIVLPPGVTPRASSLTGHVAGGRWRATYVAPPATGFDVRLTVDAGHAAALADTVVLATTYTVPGAPAGGRVPPWVRGDAITWQPRGLYVIRAASEALPRSSVPGR